MEPQVVKCSICCKENKKTASMELIHQNDKIKCVVSIRVLCPVPRLMLLYVGVTALLPMIGTWLTRLIKKSCFYNWCDSWLIRVQTIIQFEGHPLFVVFSQVLRLFINMLVVCWLSLVTAVWPWGQHVISRQVVAALVEFYFVCFLIDQYLISAKPGMLLPFLSFWIRCNVNALWKVTANGIQVYNTLSAETRWNLTACTAAQAVAALVLHHQEKVLIPDRVLTNCSQPHNLQWQDFSLNLSWLSFLSSGVSRH